MFLGKRLSENLSRTIIFKLYDNILGEINFNLNIFHNFNIFLGVHIPLLCSKNLVDYIENTKNFWGLGPPATPLGNSGPATIRMFYNPTDRF